MPFLEKQCYNLLKLTHALYHGSNQTVKTPNLQLSGRSLDFGLDLYAILENEASKVWHLSPLTLYRLLEEELETGNINYPEEP